MKKTINLVIIFVLTFILAGCKQQETPAEVTAMDIDKAATNGVLTGQETLYAQHQIAVIKTNYGEITVGFYGKESPITANNFLNLSKQGFYNNTNFIE